MRLLHFYILHTDFYPFSPVKKSVFIRMCVAVPLLLFRMTLEIDDARRIIIFCVESLEAINYPLINPQWEIHTHGYRQVDTITFFDTQSPHAPTPQMHIIQFTILNINVNQWLRQKGRDGELDRNKEIIVLLWLMTQTYLEWRGGVCVSEVWLSDWDS